MSDPIVRGCAAIFQFEAVHEAVIPSLIHALNADGIKAEVFINANAAVRRGDLFPLLPELDCTVHHVPIDTADDWHALEAVARDGAWDFILLATFQRDSVAEWARRTGKPLLGVVHNVRMFRASAAAVAAFEAGAVQLLVMAAHVAGFLGARLPVARRDEPAVIEPVYWGRQQRRTPPTEGCPAVVAVPGGVCFETRDFPGLLDGLAAAVAATGPLLLQVTVIGGGPDRERLADEIVDRHLDDTVLLAPLAENGRVPYARYVDLLAGSDLVLPLLPMDFVPYREHKITSAIHNAIGFGLPAVIDRWTANVYRVPALVTDANPRAMVEAMAAYARQPDYALLQAIDTYLAEALDRNAAEMARAISLVAAPKRNNGKLGPLGTARD